MDLAVSRIVAARALCAEKSEKVEVVRQKIRDTVTPELEAARAEAKEALDAVYAAQQVASDKQVVVARLQNKIDLDAGIVEVLDELGAAQEERSAAEAAFKSVPWEATSSKVSVTVDDVDYCVEKVERAGRLNWTVGKIKALVDDSTYANLERACRTASTVDYVLRDPAQGKRGRDA